MAVSMQSLMKNIYSYVDVLQAAHGEKAGSWDCKSLHRAYKWAEYCIQVYRQAEGKSYRGNLDKAIRKLNETPWSLGNLVIDLDLLQSAKDILTKALLQNNHLNATVYEELVKLHLKGDADSFMEICAELATDKSALEIASIMKAEINKAKTDSLLDSSSQQTNGVLILRHVQHTLDYCNQERRQKTDNYMSETLSKLLQNDIGINSTLMAICVEPDENECYDKAKLFLANYLLETLATDVGLKRRVFNTDQDLLHAVCRVDARFTILYMEHLIELGKHFSPDCTKIPVRWRYNVYVADSSRGITYEEFLTTVKTVVGMQPTSRMEIVETLVAESKKSDFNLWKTVLKDIT